MPSPIGGLPGRRLPRNTVRSGVATLLIAVSGTLPMLGPLFKDTSGKGDIHLALSLATVAVSIAILTLVGVLSGLAPALRASRLDPSDALRYE